MNDKRTSNKGHITRIVGGDKTDVNEYPWQVLVISQRGKDRKGACVDWRFSCGGSVIGDQWVLTAAHCLALECDLTAADVEVYLGEHDKTPGTDETDTIKMDVSEIIHHEKYGFYGGNPYYDFALLKLKSKIDFGSHPHIRPICLPADGSNKDYIGYTATATGWGRTNYTDHTSSSSHLLEVNLTVVTQTDCSQTYPHYDFKQIICAKGVGGKGTCKGDSGGPLVIKEVGYSGTVPGENYELIGVTSFSKKDEVKGCKDGVKGFARVTAQLDWIQEKTKDSWRTCPRT